MEIETNDLKVSVPTRLIVDSVGIQVRDGEFVGLLGPNGSGKSTLLKAIYRVMKKDSGDILFDGTPLEELSMRESALKLSVVTQHNYFNFDFKVEDVVAMGRTPHKKAMELDNAEDHRIVAEALERVDMQDFADRKFSSLSGGEQQRIILARALAQQTPCLVLDEPTNHLDIKYQLDVLDIVKSLGCTTLCALHDMNLAAQYCDRIYVLRDGKIVSQGKPEEVITEEMIQDVYGVKSKVKKDPDTGLLNVVYFPSYLSGKREGA